MNWHKPVLLFAALLCGTPAVQADQVSPARVWKLDSYVCPFGCAPLLDSVLKPRVGSMLNLDNPGEGFDLFTTCDGALRLESKQESNTDVIRELNETLDNRVTKTPRFTAHNTGLKSKTLTSAVATCASEPKTHTTTDHQKIQQSRFMFRIVSLTNESMWVFYEGNSILKFKAIQSK